MTAMKTATAAVVVALTCSSAASAVRAEPHSASRQVRVSAAGLDLTTDQGADELLRRLSRAATTACGGRPDAVPLAFNAKERYRLCRAEAMASAVSQFGVAKLTHRFEGRAEADTMRVARK